MLQPENVRDVAAGDGSHWVRDVLVKQLLVYGPRHVLWCITGSSMALTWISFAAMPPNGFPLITGVRPITLPVRVAWSRDNGCERHSGAALRVQAGDSRP